MFTQFPGLMLALILQLLLLYPDVVLSDVDGDWEYCPTNITVYRNCNATIYAIFTITMCNESGFVYHIFIRHSDSSDINDYEKFGPEDPIPPVVINKIHSRCNISETSVVNRAAGVYDIKFQFVSNVPSVITKECHDTLFIKDSIPAPNITSTTIKCDGVLIKWEGPTLAEGYNILEYMITVLGTAIADRISANDSTYHIPYKEGLEYNREYNISVAAVYCGGMGNTTTTTVYTALAPLIDYGNIEDLNSKLNSSHEYIYKIFKVNDTDCEVSYPKTVTIDLNCTRSSSHSSWNDCSISKPVTIRHDNTVIVDIIVPIDSHCSVALSFNNGHPTTPTSSSDINTNQLQSCSSSVCEDMVSIFCTFSPLSSLWGCRVELISTTDSNQTMITQMDIATSKKHEYFPNVCNGVYVIKCYGLEDINPTSTTGANSTAGVITRKVIAYGNDSSHSIVITMKSAGYNCSNTITATPSINFAVRSDNACNNNDLPFNAVVLAIVVISIVITVAIIVAAVFLVFFCVRKSKTNLHPADDNAFDQKNNTPQDGAIIINQDTH